MAANNALRLLTEYSSSGSSEDETVPGPRVSTKRGIPKDWNEDTNHKKAVRLPLPSALTLLFTDRIGEDRQPDEPSQHDGRIRSFEHERGNWTTFVFIPYEPSATAIESLVSAIATECRNIVELKGTDNLHISLTKTVVLRHHWIDSFVESIRDSLSGISPFVLSFDSLQVYSNEEQTRTFIGLKLAEIQTPVHVVKLFDKCLAEFKLPAFHKNPSFHLSVVWCVGDYLQRLKDLLPRLQLVFAQFADAHPDFVRLDVRQLVCKTGNKRYSFNLDS